MRLEKYMGCSRAAQKLEKADLVLKNAKIVNVFTDRIEKGNIAITNGMIVGIGDYEGQEEIDLADQYVTSGFIDAHQTGLHLPTRPQPALMRVKAAALHRPSMGP